MVLTLERARGCVLGAAIGDALGHPTEFMSMADIRSRFGPDGVKGFELFWTDNDGERCAPYTDDTQMAEAVLRSLLESRQQGADLDTTMTSMAARFVDWSLNPQGGHRAPGNACLSGCRALASGKYWSEAGGETAGGCGSVMRAYPFGLVFCDDVQTAEHWAVEHSRLTHRDPIALAACAAMAVGIAEVCLDTEPASVVEKMTAAAARYSSGTADMMLRAAKEAASGIRPDTVFDRLRAWAAHEAIAAAVYGFLRHPDDVRAALLEAANTPGDSDSIATLVGALVGARVGLSALPGAWVAEVERSDELDELARRLFQTRDLRGAGRSA